MKHADPGASASSGALGYQPYTAGLRRADRAGARCPARRSQARSATRSSCTSATATSTSARRITMHPHGVRYTPDYDGTYLGNFTRAGGFIAPGEEFTYTWECTPDSVGVWPYHDHGPNHTLNIAARPVRRADRPREGRARRRTSSRCWCCTSSPPQITGAAAASSSASTGAPSPATRRRSAPRSARTSPSTCSAATHLPHLPRPRPPLATRRGASSTARPSAPTRSITARWREDNPGPLAVPLPRLHPPGRRDGRLVPGRTLKEEVMSTHARTRVITALLALALAAPAMAATLPAARRPRRACRRSPRGSTTRCTSARRQGPRLLHDDPGRDQRRKAGDTVKRAARHLQGGREDQGAEKRYIKLIGDVKHPEKVVARGQGPEGRARPERRARQRRQPGHGRAASRPSTTRPTASS